MTGGACSPLAPPITLSEYSYPTERVSRRLVFFPLRSRAALDLLLLEIRDIRQHHLALYVIEWRTWFWFWLAPFEFCEGNCDCVARRRVGDQRGIGTKRSQSSAFGFCLFAVG